MRARVDEERTSTMFEMVLQGAWAGWEGTLEMKLSWSEIWHAEPHQIKFIVQAVYDLLPNPANRYIWGKITLQRALCVPGKDHLAAAQQPKGRAATD